MHSPFWIATLWISGWAMVMMLVPGSVRAQLPDGPAAGRQIAPPPEDVPTPVPDPVFPAVRGMLGIRTAEVTEPAIREFGLTVRKGALITALLRGSPAERAGLPLGGVILAVDGLKIDTPEDLMRAIRATRPNQTLELKYMDGSRLFRKRLAVAPFLGHPTDAPSTPPTTNRAQPDTPETPPPPPQPTSVGDLSRKVTELQAQVDTLQRELEQLKQMVAELLKKSGPADDS